MVRKAYLIQGVAKAATIDYWQITKLVTVCPGVAEAVTISEEDMAVAQVFPYDFWFLLRYDID